MEKKHFTPMTIALGAALYVLLVRPLAAKYAGVNV